MTHQCTSCGSQTRAGAKFCHLCGTPIATTSLPPTMPMPAAPPPAAESKAPSASLEQPAAPKAAAATEAIPVSTAYFPQTPQTYHAPPLVAPSLAMRPPPKKSGRAFKAILIMLLVLIALGLGAIATGVFFVRRAADRIARDNGLRLDLGDVQFSTRPEDINEETMGVPPYPGAQADMPIVIRARGGRDSGSFGTFTFTTTDSVDKVVAFYQDKLGENVQTINRKANGSQSVTLNLKENNANKTIVVTAAGEKTKLVITTVLGRPGRNRDEERRFEQQMREQAERIQREVRESIERNLPPPPPGVPGPDGPPPGAPPRPR